jgi:hypothetical protein
MGAQLRARSAETAEAEGTLKRLNDDLALELAQTAIDVAGIADPTPISDVVGAGLSLYRGDLIGAGLSLISVIPYAGDALGKTAKGARAAKKIEALRKSIVGAMARVAKAKRAAQSGAAASVRAKRAAEAAKKAVEAKTCKTCKPPSNRFGTRLPADDKGAWAGEKGNSVFTPHGGKPVQYKDGYPDFSPYSKKDVKIDMDLAGDRGKDFKAADEAMREAIGDPNWQRPKDMTWHHHEDGTTMQLVPRDVHDAAQHTGGVSVVTDPEY